MLTGLLSLTLIAAAVTAPTKGPTPAALISDPTPAYSFFSKYRDNYFITGGEKTQVKFQFSAKAELFTYDSNGKNDRIGGYFAYTQKSFWDTWDIAGSSPFRESNYAPEFFWAHFMQRREDAWSRLGGFKWLHYRIGFEHESNGEAGTESRSWNRPYAAFSFGFFDGDHYLLVSPLVYYPVGLRENPDIADYLGYFELGVTIGHERLATEEFGGISLRTTMTQGAADWSRPGFETTGIWRLGWPGSWLGVSLGFAPALYVQWFEGYGESLLTYNKYQRTFRIGFSLEDRFADPRLPSY